MGRTAEAGLIRLRVISVLRLASVKLRRRLVYRCATRSLYPILNFEFAIGSLHSKQITPVKQ